MTVATRPPAARPPTVRGTSGVARELAWHGPAHGLMLGVMVSAMTPGAGVRGHLLGAAVLTVLSLALAPMTRRRRQLTPVLLDVGAMTVVLVACAMTGPAVGGPAHDHGLDGTVIAVLVGIGWLVARVRCTRGVVSATTGALSAVGLIAMVAVAVA